MKAFAEKAKAFAGRVKSKGSELLKPPCQISIAFEGDEDRKTAPLYPGELNTYPIFSREDLVKGAVKIACNPGKRIEHQGIRLELIGQIELLYERTEYEFLSLSRDLEGPGELDSTITYTFDFGQADKRYESYFVNIMEEHDFLVHVVESAPASNPPISMEVGIEDCLHIEFVYDKSKMTLQDVITGTISFLLVRLKVHYMEIAIVREETTGTGVDTYTESETVAAFEIMDGIPVKAETVPLRIPLAGVPLTPTMRNVNNKFSVNYKLNLVLMDEKERRYFKRRDIVFWRSEVGSNELSWSDWSKRKKDI